MVPPRFEVIRELGAGAMGQVYEVLDRERGAHVALKMMHRDLDAEDIARLKSEFRSLVDLDHPNIVEVGELFEHDGAWGYTMELIEGMTWLEWVRRDRAAPARDPDRDETTPVRWDPVEARFEPRYDAARLWEALGQLAEALEALHARGACHRDVKPSNVLVTDAGRVVLLDFGLASAFSRGSGDLVVGTVDYMAPEQATAATAAPANDLYAVGAMLFEALVGRPPFEGTAIEVLTRKVVGAVVPPHLLSPEIDLALDHLCVALLALDPAARPSATEVLRRIPGREPRSRGIAPGHGRSQAILVGRDTELARLRGWLDAPPSTPTVVSLVGGPGDGKSALLMRLAADARRAGHVVGFGECRAREHVRLNGWDDLVDGLARELARHPRLEQRALMPPDIDALARVFPAAARLVDTTAGEGEVAGALEDRAAAALGALLARLGAERAALVILDDAHQATADTLAWLDLVLATPGLRAIVVLAHRTPPLDAPLEVWLDRAAEREPAPLRMFLGRLDAAHTLELARYLVPDPAVAARLATASAGHPLVLELLADAGVDASADPAALIGAALAATPPLARACLEVLAVAARPLALALLADAHDTTVDVVGQALTAARHRRLVRMTGLRRSDVAEPYHALVRTTALQALDGDAARRAHARLATALEHTAPPDAGACAAAFVAAGDGARAAVHALALAAAARDGTGFAAAARMCDRVLALDLPAPQRAALLRAGGEAWFAGGDPGRAAAAFEMACPLVDAASRAVLEQRAAGCLLRIGDVAHGLELARRVADHLGMPMAASRGATLRRLLIERARLRLRGLTLRRGEPRPALIERADACHALALGLLTIDVPLTMLFHSAGLRHALDSGAPDRAARGLALEGAFVASGGHRAAPRAGGLVTRARDLAAEAGDPALHGFIDSAATMVAQLTGDFAAAVTHADQARARRLGGRVGLVWEERTAEVFALRALAWSGRWGELEARRRRVARDAEISGDQFGRKFASLAPSTLGLLGTGATDEVEALLARARELADAGSFQIVQLFPVYTEATLQLRAGRGADAVELLARHWPAMERSRMLRVEVLGITLWDLRARAMLQAAGDDPAGLRLAARWARRTAMAPWSVGPALLIGAQIMRRRGQHDAARRGFAEAAQRCDQHGLALHAAAARWHGGDEDAAVAAAQALGVTDTDGVFSLLAPR